MPERQDESCTVEEFVIALMVMPTRSCTLGLRVRRSIPDQRVALSCHDPRTQRCKLIRRSTQKKFLKTKSLRTSVLVARWTTDDAISLAYVPRRIRSLLNVPSPVARFSQHNLADPCGSPIRANHRVPPRFDAKGQVQCRYPLALLCRKERRHCSGSSTLARCPQSA